MSRTVARPLPFAAPAARPSRVPTPVSDGGAHALVTSSASMQAVLLAMTRLAPHARATLITGETGTGKSTIARVVHGLGPHRGGAFRIAAGADVLHHLDTPVTLFLPDVADLPREAQVALTRAMANAAHAPAGEGLHVIASTDRDLSETTAPGGFRAELYYRLTAFELRLPPLRERRDDIPALAAAFLADVCARLGLPATQITSGAARLLQGLTWPGNLRELRNVIERAAVLGDGEVLAEPGVRAALALGPPVAKMAAPPSTRLDHAQHQHVRAVLAAAKGNKTIAAAHLGVSRRALYRLVDRLERCVSSVSVTASED